MNHTISVNRLYKLSIGYAGENEVQTVLIDYSPWVDAYGEGMLNLLMQRSNDTEAYPVVLTYGGGTALWVISNIDTSYKGLGKAQLVYSVNGKIKKSAVFKVDVVESITDSETVPDPYQPWVEQILEASETIVDAVDDAEQSAESAKGYAEEAERIVESMQDNFVHGTEMAMEIIDGVATLTY